MMKISKILISAPPRISAPPLEQQPPLEGSRLNKRPGYYSGGYGIQKIAISKTYYFRSFQCLKIGYFSPISRKWLSHPILSIYRPMYLYCGLRDYLTAVIISVHSFHFCSYSHNNNVVQSSRQAPLDILLELQFNSTRSFDRFEETIRPIINKYTPLKR